MDTNKSDTEQQSQNTLSTDDSSQAQSTPTNNTSIQQTVISNKIEVLLKHVANAPILKNKKYTLERTKSVRWLANWLKQYMRLDPSEQLFIYVNQEFAPCLDTEIGTIFDCFSTNNKVILYYAITPAYG